MLYEGAIRFLKQAGEAMQNNASQRRYEKLTKAGDIIVGLQSALDMTGGGQRARELYDFYASIDARILSLHRSSDVEECNRLINELRDMRDVWDAIDRGE